MLISGITYAKQKDPDYCAPTCASMILSKFGIDLTQEEIAKKIMKRDNDGHKRTFTNDICSFLATQIFFVVSISNLSDENAWNQLKKFIEREIPVMITQRFSLKSPTGHFRIIIGHEVVGNNDTEIMTYHDPVSGSFQTMKKEVFQELWRPNTSGYVDIRIPNQMVATLKEPFISTNDECVFCKNPDIETKQVNTEEACTQITHSSIQKEKDYAMVPVMCVKNVESKSFILNISENYGENCNF